MIRRFNILENKQKKRGSASFFLFIRGFKLLLTMYYCYILSKTEQKFVIYLH
jgi:hypothetical protein